MGLWNNKKLLSKAAITGATGDFTNGIGLSLEETDRFIDYIVDESRLKDKVNIVRTKARKRKINFIDLDDEDVIVPAVAATDPGDTVGVNTSQRELDMKEGVAIARISDDALEDGIEGDAFADHLMRMVAKAVSNQLVKTLMMGVKDASAPTKFIQSWNGWLYYALTEGHVVDAASYDDRYIDRTKLSALLKAVPTKYLEDNLNPALFMGRHVAQDWRDSFGDRETGGGDNAITTAAPPPYAGLPIEVFNTISTGLPVVVTGASAAATTVDGNQAAGITDLAVADSSDFTVGDVITIDRGGSREETRTVTAKDTGELTVAALTYAHLTGETVEKVTSDGSFAMLAEYKNLIWGIQRDIRIETDRLPRLRSTDWVISMKMDSQVMNPDAIGVLKNLKVRP